MISRSLLKMEDGQPGIRIVRNKCLWMREIVSLVYKGLNWNRKIVRLLTMTMMIKVIMTMMMMTKMIQIRMKS